MTREDYLTKLLQTAPNKSKKLQTATADKYPQGYFKEKCCRHCGRLFIPKAPSELYCSDFCKDYERIEAYYIKNYNITIKEYLDLAERQHYVCAICGMENFPMKKGHSGCLVVDHDHTTNKIRGLLCHNCNRALGLLQDNTSFLLQALHYLRKCND